MLDRLPDHLEERSQFVGTAIVPKEDGPVVVWLKSAHRFHENPALDVGKTIALAYDLPLLVYHGIDERYPHSSVRHHNTLLDAALDVARKCEENGIKHTLHVARDGHRPSVMKEFAKSASAIITDLFPLPPWSDWVKSIGKIAECPVVEVDCHCVIPMPLYGKSVDRPFKFRNATKKMRKARIQNAWPKVNGKAKMYEGALPFTPIDVERDIANLDLRLELIKKCKIDPSVMPVWSQKGGEIAAMSRWQAFLDNGLNGYARRRNNAADPNGVSRLSSAFHYGFLSPMKVAREAAAVGTKSADKYLDELLIFREHAWHHIYSCSDPYSVSNLPTWALQSWQSTQDDTRLVLAKHKLEFSDSPNTLWNDCQTSLLSHGELHNNLRMTWGKAFPLWTKSLEESVEFAQKLNDKYALDGRDPSSVVGVQWCHGLFDRPFNPSIPIMGLVRKRDLETHYSRLDSQKYSEHVNRGNTTSDNLYIVCGNGLQEAYLARVLQDNGCDVILASNNSKYTEETISKLSMKELPSWVKERFDSILMDSNSGEVDALITSLTSKLTKIFTTDSQIYDFGDVKSMIAESEKINRIKLIQLDSSGNLIATDFTEDSKIEINQRKDNLKQIFGHMKALSWELLGLIWRDNSDFEHQKYSIQSKLV